MCSKIKNQFQYRSQCPLDRQGRALQRTLSKDKVRNAFHVLKHYKGNGTY